MNTFSLIREIVRQIPSGQVATYGQIAKIVCTRPRVVGWALRGNPDISIPCHRVVKANGVLAANFSLGNWPEQRRRLQSEGLQFSGQTILNFPSHMFLFSNPESSF
jgi:O-6-methylguanine DNA methyltransferase